MQEKKPSIVIAVSEGVKLEDGRYVCELADDVHAVDAFGHKALTGTDGKSLFGECTLSSSVNDLKEKLPHSGIDGVTDKVCI